MVNRFQRRDKQPMEALGRGLVAGLAGGRVMGHRRDDRVEYCRGEAERARDQHHSGSGRGESGWCDAAGRSRRAALQHAGALGLWHCVGVFRGALDIAGLRGPLATLLHLVAVLGAEQAVLPALGVAKPTPAYGLKAMGTDTLHHVVYAGASGLAYDYL
jgi:hypothetical protein